MICIRESEGLVEFSCGFQAVKKGDERVKLTFRGKTFMFPKSLKDRYELILSKEKGSGGFGLVHECFDKVTDKMFVIKIVRARRLIIFVAAMETPGAL
jgi:hypothetical protein